jgi:hypothetical protein
MVSFCIAYHCEHCDESQYSYHSCKNRRCPERQNQAGQQWLEQQRDLLLPVPYYLIAFSLPTELH